jgi:hypothetical protein
MPAVRLELGSVPLMDTVEDNEFAKRYPWDQWFDGNIRKAVRGTDFEVEATSFRVTIRAAAKRHGYTVRTKVRGNSVTFQATKIPEPEQQEAL